MKVVSLHTVCRACSPELLELVSRTTSDPHQWRTTQVDPPPTHGIAIPSGRGGVQSAVCQEPINQAKLPLTHTQEGGTPHRRRKRCMRRPETAAWPGPVYCLQPGPGRQTHGRHLQKAHAGYLTKDGDGP